MNPNEQPPQNPDQQPTPVIPEVPAQPAPPAPVSPPPEHKTPFLIIGITLLVVIVAAAAILIFMPFKKKAPSTPRTDTSQNNAQSIAADKTARRNDLARVAAYANEYVSNNNGKVPTAEELSAYIAQTAQSLIDPTTEKPYIIQAGAPLATNEIQYSSNAKCNDDSTMLAQGSSSRQLAFLGMHGPNDFSCVAL